MAEIYLSLGTNLGQRRANLRRAVSALAEEVKITAVSPVYETSPWGVREQPDFLNICIAATTTRTPHELLARFKTLEAELGRRPASLWGPRHIDIDILFYDDLVLHDQHLTLPHPRLHERAFVLAPLADITPDLTHPQTSKTVRDMLAAVDQTAVRRLSRPLFDLRSPITGTPE